MIENCRLGQKWRLFNVDIGDFTVVSGVVLVTLVTVLSEVC